MEGEAAHGGGPGGGGRGAADEAVAGPGLLQPGQKSPAGGPDDRGGVPRPFSGPVRGPAAPAGGGGLHRRGYRLHRLLPAGPGGGRQRAASGSPGGGY